MTETEKVAEIVIASIKSATAPLLARIAVQDERIAAFERQLAAPPEWGTWKDWANHYGPMAASYEDRLKTLEARAPTLGPQGERGERGERGEKGLDGSVGVTGERGLQGPQGEPGPVGERGEQGEKGDPGQQGERGLQGEVGPVGAQGERGLDGVRGERGEKGDSGRDAEAIDLAALAKSAATYIEAPTNGADGRDGKDVSVEDVTPLLAELVTNAVDALPKARDGEKGDSGINGVGLAGAVIDNDGQLVITLSDGSMRQLGRVVGSVGDTGERGNDGKDGINGLAPDLKNLEIVQHDERTIEFRTRDEMFIIGTVKLAGIIDQGTYDAMKAYERGDTVSFGGSLFIAQRDTQAGEKPEERGGAWRLAAKRGRDGRNAKDGERGPQGPAGKDRVYVSTEVRP